MMLPDQVQHHNAHQALIDPPTHNKKAPQARVGSQPLHRGMEGVGEEEPISDASSQVESEGSDPPFFLNLYGVAVQCLFCRYYLFPVIRVVIFSGRGSCHVSSLST
jgi:hypothetical protein